MTKKIDEIDFKYGIMAIDVSETSDDGMLPVVHGVLFPNPPSFEDYMSIYDELETDHDLMMTDKERYFDYVLVPATDNIVALMKDAVKGKNKKWDFKLKE